MLSTAGHCDQSSAIFLTYLLSLLKIEGPGTLNLRVPTVERFNRSRTGNNRLRPALPITEKGRCNAFQ
jgi:hypothetical protein